MTIAEHLSNIKNYENQLASVGKTILDGIKQYYLMRNIPAEFGYIVQAGNVHKELTLEQLKEGLKA